ncbi:MAG: hypothetical protein LQ350_008020 [Teloschistes chrysophthalmus]|nr:MAG: hypothetical protein LQ350_008020 [Niorma chrysophthalma]
MAPITPVHHDEALIPFYRVQRCMGDKIDHSRYYDTDIFSIIAMSWRVVSNVFATGEGRPQTASSGFQLLASCGRTFLDSHWNMHFYITQRFLAVSSALIDVIRQDRALIETSIDDIQDDSNLRRGKDSAHTIFGVAQTINSANHMYFLAQKELMGLNNSLELLKIFNEELLNLHRGQGMDLYWRDTMTPPTEGE